LPPPSTRRDAARGQGRWPAAPALDDLPSLAGLPRRSTEQVQGRAAQRNDDSAGRRLENKDLPPGHAAETLLAVVARLFKHDRLTRGYSERVRAYTNLIAEEMGVPAEDLDKLQWAALLHDVGKMSVPAEILNKAGRPTDAEWEVLRGHPGAAIPLLTPLAPWLGDWALAATQHHERWDGDGYPGGLAGPNISLAGRIVAVADAYDVMTSVRSYKSGLSPALAREELTSSAGTQFDPAVVRAFLAVGLGRLRFVAAPLPGSTSWPGWLGFRRVPPL